MSHAHDHANTVPAPALAMAGALVAVSLLMTAAVTSGVLEREAVPAVERSKANVAEHRTRTLTFADQPDGSVRVTDAGSRSRRATSISTPMSSWRAMCRSIPATKCASTARRCRSASARASASSAWPP